MKTIKTINDLAINGAPPAFVEPLHVGRPNIGSREAFLKYAEEIFDRRWLTNNGPIVQEFEQRVADYHGVKHCVAMCNGTIALEIAIRALKLEGEVIIPSYTFIATAHALHWQAITPVFADIDPVTHALDPEAVRSMITPRTTGIIGVHLWSRGAPVEALQEIADEYNLKLMFDAAHAFGCSYKGTMIGNFGACEILSFHATKFFNTFEGGAVLTNDNVLADAMRLMRNFGFSGMDNVIHPGTNGKMIELCAAMGIVNFDSLEGIVGANQHNYQVYREAFSDLPGISLLAFDESERNNFQYVVIEVDEKCPANREQIIQALHAENILARRYFWPGCHNMTPYNELYPHAGLLLPNTKKVSDRVVVLPTGTTMDDSMVNAVTSVIRVLLEDKA
ncbi:MAG: DegT/DnrJ/EryC1/StrS family aminotransferase [Arenicellales bacterium]